MLNLLPWQGQLIVPFAIWSTMHCMCVQTALNPLNCPRLGCVTTTRSLTKILPPPTGMAPVLVSAPPRPAAWPLPPAAPLLDAVAFGVLAEPQDAASMAEAIAALYERDIDALGAAARARVLRQFTWHRAFQAQMATYGALAGSQRQSGPGAQIATDMPLRWPSS